MDKDKDMEELKKIDDTYQKESKKVKSVEDIAQLREQIEQLIEKLDISKAKIETYNAELKVAKLEKNATKTANIEGKISREEANKARLIKRIQNAQDVIKKNKEIVDGWIEKVYNQKPEMKKAIDQALKVKTARKVKGLFAEKANIEILQGLMDNHPSVKNNIIGMKNALSESKILKEELAKLDPVKDAATIATKKADIINAKSKYIKNKDLLMECAKKDKVELSEQFLKDFIEKTPFKQDKGTGEYNIEATLRNKLKGIDKNIKNSEMVLSKLEGKEIKFNYNTIDPKNPVIEVEMKEKFKAPSTKGDEESGLPAISDDKPKRWQLIQRFRNWRQRRKEDKMRAEHEQELPDVYTLDEYLAENKDQKTNKFAQAYKYAVVRETSQRMEESLYKRVKYDQKVEKSKTAGDSGEER